MNLSTLILGSLGVGIVFGALLNGFFPEAIAPLDHYLLTPLGNSFLRLIQFVVVPIVFSSLVLGLTKVQDTSQVGRYLLKLFTGYVMTAATAVFLGMAIALILQPGVGMTGLSINAVASTTHRSSLIDWLVNLVPVNPLEALATSNLLQTIFSAALIVTGIQLAGDKSASFVSFIDSIYAIFEKVLSVILYTAPVGVFALISSVIATQGFGLIARLLYYILGMLLAFAIMMGLYVLILLVLKAKPIKFFQSFFPTFSLGFGTASTNAVLPVTLQDAQERYGMSAAIASFAIPLGTVLKRDGSAIYQAFNALFIAQIYHIPLTTDLLVAIALSTLLVSFSTAGVPGSGIIMMTTVLSAAGLPLEGVAIVAGVDRLTDGFKTIVNITGNIVNAILLSRWENPEASLEERGEGGEGVDGWMGG
ncbi:dicarboxylate/amino acid:cation symporter [Leptothermofonsia sp. ETS-13]|uniref:dicarboxylate/amino acid:cation symporter n=1 Tax=Leptothermofonsia sp. ETS-13 TaxID=3035696 RepID=UPI003B9F56EB